MTPSPPPPPPTPPKSPSVRTTETHMTFETETEAEHQSPARPTHAQRAIRQQASLHFRAPSVPAMDSALAELNRAPSLSFLTHDPADPISSTAGSSSSCSISTSSSGRHPGKRVSALTTRSFQTGMADAETASTAHSGHDHDEPNPDHPSFGDGSDMAVRSSPVSSKPKSLKSVTSTSSKTRKRASNSTIHRRSFQRKYGQWEVDMSPLLEHNSRQREEELELAALLGRATVLERMLKAGKRVSGTPISPLKQLASTRSSQSRSTFRRSYSTTRKSLSTSIRSIRRQLSRRLKRKPSPPSDEDQFTEIDSQSGFGSIPPVEVVLSEKERGWVVLLPERSEELAELPPPLPEKDDGCLPSPTCLASPSPANVERETYVQSPHLGHRSPDHRRRQSVLSYISAGRWSASTRGRNRRRLWTLGLTVGCLVGVIVLTGVLAGLLSKRVNVQP